jgi:AcrR family transcriptional regulator
MSRQKEDRRTQYSKRMIRESLYELMKEKPLNKISVTEICNKADVTRSTFYSYYTDIYDLHQKIIKEFFSIQKSVIKHTKEALLQKSDIKEITYDDYYEIISYYLTTVEENKELYKFIFNQNSTTAIHTSFGKVLYHTIKEVLNPLVEEKRFDEIKTAFTFVSGGTTAIITQWIQKNCDTSVEELSKHIAGYYYVTFKAYTMEKTDFKSILRNN